MKNNKNLRTVASALLILCELFLAACGSGTTDVSGKNPDTSESSTTVSGDVSYTDDQREYWEPLKPENLNGYEFRVAVTGAGKFMPEEENGDVINDAYLRRNRAVSELYNIKYSEIVADQKQVQASILSGDNAYDVYFTALYRNAANMAAADMLTDINKVKSLSLDSVWWDQNLLNTTQIGGKQFFLAGDIDYTLYGRTTILMFNKGMMADVTDDSIYETVKAGKWTYDAFDKLQRNATRDLNGDNKMDENDSYGITMSAVHASVLYSAAGERIIDNDNGKYSLKMNDARGLDVITKIFDITLGASDFCYNTDKVSQDGVWDRVREMFRSDKSLFQSTVLYNIIKQRSMESDFGIIPYPKYNEAQEKYYSTSYNGNLVFVIPKTVSDTETVGKIMNALAFEGRFTVKTAFYDEALGTKFIRDDESKEMIDIIYDNVIYDVGFMYNIGGLGELLRDMHKAENSNFASEYAGKAEAAQTELNKLIEKISEFN